MISVNLAFDGYVGLSTDTKPTEDVNNGSRFYEMDTGASFMYDEEGQQWLEQSSEGGSGGGSGAGAASLSVTMTDTGSAYVLDKTWAEINEVFSQGGNVIVFWDQGYDDITNHAIVETFSSQNNYRVTMYNSSSNTGRIALETSSETGYPEYVYD